MIRFLLIILFLYSNLTLSQSNLDSIVENLNNKILKKEYYDLKKVKRIDSLKKNLNDNIPLIKRYQINNKIFNEYQFYSFNKALNYIEKNVKIAKKLENTHLLNQSKLKLGLLLVNTGRYKESLDALNSIKRKYLSPSLLSSYYLAFEEGYSGLSYNTAVKNSKSEYTQLYYAYQDSLYKRLEPNSETALRIIEREYRDKRQLGKALDINTKRLSKVTLGNRLYSLITFERSLLYELKNELSKQKKYLALSAISDIKSSVKDNASMGTLAEIYFSEGNISLAHKYINSSYEDAEFYNSKLRLVNIAKRMPLITRAYNKKNSKQRANLQAMLIFISFLTILLVISILFVYKQNNKLKLTRNSLKETNNKLSEFNNKLNASHEELKLLYLKLSESNEIKEHYIGTFLNLYSDYINKLDSYRKLVSKYVNANRIGALLKLSKSKHVIDQELQIFNNHFDNSFLHIHPNFVNEINKLLKPEEKIKFQKGDSLNTSLRILALIKLGITSSSKIANILRFSVNTIYNYRAEIKKKAINKKDFEDKVRAIN